MKQTMSEIIIEAPTGMTKKSAKPQALSQILNR
jgi:hypothetical protein